MAYNTTNPYDIDEHLAELYDQQVTGTEDVALIRQLVAESPLAGRSLKILEPFTGTGRILLPLAADGHEVTGIDSSQGMLERAQQKLAALPADARRRVWLIACDVVGAGADSSWPGGFDLVILGGNCLYELGTPQEQEQVIRLAARSLRPGGYLYLDNDHMEGELERPWRDTNPQQRGIQGVCADGTVIESWMQTVWFDAPARLVQFRRWIKVRYNDGTQIEREYYQQKHPVSAGEVRGWLEQNGFTIIEQFGDRDRRPYSETAPRAIFWARCDQTP